MKPAPCVMGFALGLFAISSLFGQVKGTPPYRNPDLSPERRAADLVSRMTLEEKAGQMRNSAPAIPRLGIPQYDWWNEALHGVARAGLATVFPQAIGLAATWDTGLMHRIADTISTEARAKYNQAQREGNHARYFGLTFWSPNINIFRDPRWGRGQETYGEDPYLTGRMAVAFITGMQGTNPHYLKTVATAKHYAVHSGPESLRHEFDVRPGAEYLKDTYLPAFRASVMEGKVASVMCAYNAVDGVPACASHPLLEDTLRHAWGFQGYVVSDCGAVGDILRGHKYKPTMPAAAAAAVDAGTDLDCGTEYRALVDAVKQALIPESEIDRAVQRLFVARIRLGMFDPPERVPFSAIPYSEVDSPAHRMLALEAARKSIVLLKNDHGALPLGSSVRRIVVTGPGADDPDALLGNYNGTPSSIVTPLAGIESEFGKKAKVQFALGSAYTAQSNALVPPNVLAPGLHAEYFDNPDLSGHPLVARTEPRVYFNWDMRDPALPGRISRRAFSARWTGTIRVAHTGDYQLGVTRFRCEGCGGPDSVRLFLDDKPLVGEAEMRTRNPRTEQAATHLESGRAYKLRLEYRQRGGGSGIELVWRPPANVLLRDAVEAARNSDVAIACLGLNSSLEGEEMKIAIPGFAGGDRTDIQLPEPQRDLLHALVATGKPVVVVLVNGSALAVNYAAEHAAAIMEAWYGGEAGGTAIAETLAGINNPAGRLPVTFYRSVDQLPPFDNYSMQNRTYHFFRGKPLYPFGYGMSYSSFRYSDPRVRREGQRLLISARVTNTSRRDGDEVAQLYISGGGPAIRGLQGIERIHLAAGASETIRFSTEAANPAGRKLTISVGGGQPSRERTGIAYVQTSVQ